MLAIIACKRSDLRNFLQIFSRKQPLAIIYYASNCGKIEWLLYCQSHFNSQGYSMKKTLLASLTASFFILTGCDDKALTDKLAKAEEQIQQLTKDKASLQTELAELKQAAIQQDNQAPSLQVEIVEVFNKEETIKHPKDPQDDFGSEETKITVFASSAKTGVEWIDKILVNSLMENYTEQDQLPANPTSETLKEQLQQIFEGFSEEAKEIKPFALTQASETIYIGQRNHIISFVQNHYSFTGGAHGVGYSRYLNLDANKKSLIGLDDLVSPNQQEKLKALLWERYTEERRDENGEISTFVEKADFYIAPDFYFTEHGISFVYPVYALGSYAEGPIELELYFAQINSLLNKDYQRTKKDGFNPNAIEY